MCLGKSGKTEPSRIGTNRFPALLPVLLLAVFILSGCGGPKLEREGANPDGSVSMGKLVLVTAPAERFRFYEKSDALAANGSYYATFVSGEASPYTNEDGDEAELYDAQIYLLTYEGTDAEDAEEKTAAYLAAANGQYDVVETSEEEIGGISWTVLSYRTASGTSPYAGGCAAFGCKGTASVYADLVYTEKWDGDAVSVLREQLQRLTVSS